MTDLTAPIKPITTTMEAHSPGLAFRSLVIGLTAFLTVVDLFATQAILPSLTRHYGVTPAAMGFAVNASTFGMAAASLVVGFFSPHINRRTMTNIAAAGFTVEREENVLSDILKLVDARP